MLGGAGDSKQTGEQTAVSQTNRTVTNSAGEKSKVTGTHPGASTSNREGARQKNQKDGGEEIPDGATKQRLAG